VEEVHELREPVEEREEVRIGVEDTGEGALWLSCVMTPDALKGEVHAVSDQPT
jgi:hypothetical protein